MSVPVIKQDESVGNIRAELVYTRARLKADTRTQDLATVVDDLIRRATLASNNQQQAWDAETEADAMVDARDDALDDVVRDFAANLLFVVKDRTSDRFTLYFDTSPANVIRMGLQSELTKVKPWVAKIAGEPEAQVQAFGAKLQAAIADGDTAIAQRDTARTNRAVQRVRELHSLVDDVNAARRSLYGLLVQRGEQLKLGADWAERFFKHAVRTAKAPVASAPTPPAP